jgi:uncharacterized YigZ family protein
MLYTDLYLTLAAPAEGIFKDKGSRFLSYAYPVQDEQDVKLLLQNIKREHHAARHHCYAFRLGKNGLAYRANDDGEPSGTAGKPILGQLTAADLTNTLVVVVRYFGGTLLGTSGLIAAYRAATADAIAHAKIVQRTWNVELQVCCSYAQLSDVMKVVSDAQLTPTAQTYEDECCRMTLVVREGVADAMRKKIEDLGI